MRRLLIVLSVLLLLPLSASAWMSPIVCSGGGQSASCADSSCDGFLVCQNFEGSGYDNSESWTEADGGTIDEDYTSVVLRGSQSLFIATSGSDVYSFGATNEVYGHILFRIENLGNFCCLRILDASDNILMTIDISLSYFRQQAPWYGNLAAASADTTYRIWFHYRCKIGVTNGIGESGITDTATRNVPAYTGSSAVTSTAQPAKIKFYASTWGTYFDQVLVDEANIATVCE